MALGGAYRRCLLAFAAAAAGVASAAAGGCGSSTQGDTGPIADGSGLDSAGDAQGEEPSTDATSDRAPGEPDGTIDAGEGDGGAEDADAALPVDAADESPADADAADADAGTEASTDAGTDADVADAADASDLGDAWPDGSIVFLDASCPVEIEQPPLLPGSHVPIGSTIQWDSNPPSSGPHYPIWAAYQAYTTPVPRGYYVHDLEHGAIVFLYNCGDAGCPDVVAALQAASDAIPDDPLCTSFEGSAVRVRTVITPDPLLDVPVAAAAWGWVYKANCVDDATLRDFAMRHYGQGPETLCNNGQPTF
jgi:hypothetical protein